jgi:APA family basic amino acid/polyamine antiporter
LLRILGAGFGVAVGVGSVIGTGILRTPGTVASHLGSAPLVLIVWALGGAYSLLCVSSVAELGTMLPTVGGWYVYARRAFGEKIGFVIGCCDSMIPTIAIAYLAIALGEFAAGLYPGLATHVRLVAVGGLGFLTLVNWIGLRAGSRMQALTSLAKALGLLALVVACFTITPKTAAIAPSVAANLLGAKHSLFLGIVLALQGVIVTYGGWYAPIYFVEEDRNPSSNLPRAMTGTVLACTVIYLLVNAALVRVLHMQGLAGSLAPAADAALLIFGGYGRQFILILSVVTVISAINAALLMIPRVLFAMARDGLFPQRLTSVNTGGTPAAALFLCTFASVCLVLTGTFETLIAVNSILIVTVYLSGFVALLVLRKREPALPRPHKAWLFPWSTIAVLLASAAFLIGSVIGDLRHSLFTIIFVLLTYAVSVFVVRKKTYSPV